MPETLLAIKNISVQYGHARALNNVSLTIAAGGITSIVGANGAGKTTLVRAIAGMVALAEGQSQQAVAEAIGVCRKTICNWLCVMEFSAAVDRLSCMIDISSRAERLRIAMALHKSGQRSGGHGGPPLQLLSF